MKALHVVTPYDVSPETALDAVQNHDGPIVLDLDETLYLRNSTEDFIDSARPRLLALVLLRVLDVVKPWRWTGGDETRDVWRVRCVASCFPRTQRNWRNRVALLAQNFSNRRLMAALNAPHTTTIIATAGFQPIVAPLVAALGLAHVQIVAARLSNFTDRREGKLRRAVCVLGDDIVRRALVLTDSAHDMELLKACARPLRAVWPESRHRNAFSGVYLPGQYLSQVKRPGARYIVRGILQEDLALWVLCSLALAALPILHVAGLLLLLVSFWAIYERGYVDNDLIAARFEADPKLSAEFVDTPVVTPPLQPWIWAVSFGVAALFLLRWPATPAMVDFVAWGGVLLATYGWFLLYNRFDKSTRVWMFAGLQLARSAAFVALVPIAAIGVAAIGAHVLAKWVPYHTYRQGNKEWPDAPFHLIRLLFFMVLGALFAFSSGVGALLNWTAAALLAWNVFRAHRELRTAFLAARRLDRNRATPQ